jgi:hypothetical protein
MCSPDFHEFHIINGTILGRGRRPVCTILNTLRSVTMRLKVRPSDGRKFLRFVALGPILSAEKMIMCFSEAANFVGSGVLAGIGVVTLTKVKHRRELMFAALPTLFAVHQFIEGFVWLGLDGILSPAVTHNMGAAFVLYAQGLLPFLLPLSVLLFEPDVKDRRRMLPFVIVGSLTALYILWALIAFPLEVYVRSNSIVYINQGTNNTLVAVLYVIATCGPLFLSKVRPMVLFGTANLTILLTVMAVKRYAFTSLWCAYAAAASIIILAYFWKTSAHRPLRYSYSS